MLCRTEGIAHGGQIFVFLISLLAELPSPHYFALGLFLGRLLAVVYALLDDHGRLSGDVQRLGLGTIVQGESFCRAGVLIKFLRKKQHGAPVYVRTISYVSLSFDLFMLLVLLFPKMQLSHHGGSCKNFTIIKKITGLRRIRGRKKF